MIQTTRTGTAGLLLFLTAEVAAEPAFLPRRDFGFDGQREPSAIVIDDFNHDSIPDLAVVNFASSGVTVMIGNGDGTFSFHGAIVEYNIPDGASSIASGDFNGDGHIDLAVTTRYGNSVQLLLGTGLGDFRRAGVIPAGDTPGFIAAADFNGDEILDLLVVNSRFVGSVSVLLGNGDGTFQAPRSFPVGQSPEAAVVADFNGDGIPDVAVTAFNDRFRPEIEVLLGQGDGSFGAFQMVDPGTSHGAVAAGDFNGDKIPDLVATTPGGFEILLGNGDGTFGAPRIRTLSSATFRVATADLDGDRILDLAISNTIQTTTAEKPTTITVLRGNGDGTFGDEQVLHVGNGPSFIAIRDLNGDQQPDLVVSNSASSAVSVLINAAKPAHE